MKRILRWTGLEVIDRKKSKREFWSYGPLEIAFIRFTEPKTLEFMEVEGRSKKEVDKLRSSLGSSVEKVGEEIFEKFD